jgi:predicted DNA-binding WGR domain protein
MPNPLPKYQKYDEVAAWNTALKSGEFKKSDAGKKLLKSLAGISDDNMALCDAWLKEQYAGAAKAVQILQTFHDMQKSGHVPPQMQKLFPSHYEQQRKEVAACLKAAEANEAAVSAAIVRNSKAWDSMVDDPKPAELAKNKALKGIVENQAKAAKFLSDSDLILRCGKLRQLGKAEIQNFKKLDAEASLLFKIITERESGYKNDAATIEKKADGLLKKMQLLYEQAKSDLSSYSTTMDDKNAAKMLAEVTKSIKMIASSTDLMKALAKDYPPTGQWKTKLETQEASLQEMKTNLLKRYKNSTASREIHKKSQAARGRK